MMLRVATVRARSSEGAARGTGNQSTVRRNTENFGDKRQSSAASEPPFRDPGLYDARLDPAKYAGLAEGDAHVIRNAGGRASDDAIRSLVISYKLLRTREWFIIHHTDCGMRLFANTTWPIC
jgi:carbonic anhydrase